ncbi:MAG: hypothetical protein ACI9NQ_001902 [Paracoccaceae bacterium]
MQRFFLLLISAAGLVSCSSSSSSESGLESSAERTGARKITIGEDGGNNPFAFNKEEVQKGDDGSITGGKRSQYDSQMKSAYAQANGKIPNYMESSYQKKAWAGGKDYSTGSYQTAKNRNAGKKSWFGGRKSNEASQVARASGQDYSTGSYRTRSANETGRAVRTGSNAYTESRTSNGWGRAPVILTSEEYRSISMGQAKSLLGR